MDCILYITLIAPNRAVGGDEEYKNLVLDTIEAFMRLVWDVWTVR